MNRNLNSPKIQNSVHLSGGRQSTRSAFRDHARREKESGRLCSVSTLAWRIIRSCVRTFSSMSRSCGRSLAGQRRAAVPLHHAVHRLRLVPRRMGLADVAGPGDVRARDREGGGGREQGEVHAHRRAGRGGAPSPLSDSWVSGLPCASKRRVGAGRDLALPAPL